MELAIGIVLMLLVGLSLGLVGSGGSILTVPILVSILGIEPKLAIVYSLFIVGITALAGAIRSFIQKQVDFKIALSFGLPSIIAVYTTRAYLVKLLPETLGKVAGLEITKDVYLMILFSFFMIFASFSMIKDKQVKKKEGAETSPMKKVLILLAEGLGVGVLTGLVGAGGGFLIIPVLVILAGLDMKKAVGTSLLIIALKSLSGFAGEMNIGTAIDWHLLSYLSAAAVVGIFIGFLVSKKVDASSLKKGFGWFVLVMGIYVVISTLAGK